MKALGNEEDINFWFLMILKFWQIMNTTVVLTPESELKDNTFTPIKKNSSSYDEITRTILKNCSSPIS
jgi:hypothetical protein